MSNSTTENLNPENPDSSTPASSNAAEEVIAIISLGSNLPSQFGSPEDTILEAVRRLGMLAGDESAGNLQCSSLYLTEPIDCEEGTPDFVNAAVALKVDARLSPRDFLSKLLDIEVEFGRELDTMRAQGKNLARSLDLDLICFGNQELNEEGLILPHPRALQRRFVLEPIAEIYPHLLLPGQQHSMSYLLENLTSAEAVRKL
ncbi:MAG: 2-amino-4-hydroxy-6-hydroxymethyldihydropteridine diphosphokinase [Gammaproteobacteria bacterium]|jgi:2-amino-4-hydroxy-6-hydroxymethyldihydropteridine diphosphokinase|nr:2-amino-4-hydroxy-6-hydroxymethyldihydropteridine diphosphokinase [Gammaproteobacteria bacterium]MBT3858283.1 2-amino-4-hydroxy-6-hydroxymethyldihydropteridine diphosphokinase [Gammaproteobacteria bacterium]MBT3988594.1 2-amino-4-hydroxy-6-hydroxymethyldihydropteridine diphosphokinase [Gammaproteobacteria bacterium]MBT4255148.1 2-amino-4-hydroxy-6-hydroxymethyldihydropteridine diphosphokinase [Gammaproteobacteria bacterium]MBT4580468.1 2-amino-4-hydroxy-6-hydroxymethyldihydropteridine diphos